jgi:hypothetical protein
MLAGFVAACDGQGVAGGDGIVGRPDFSEIIIQLTNKLEERV